jgi:putative transposase
MLTILRLLYWWLFGWMRSRAALQTEIMALRHQLLVLQRATCGRRLWLKPADRVLWVWLSRLWKSWRSTLRIREAGNGDCLEPQGIPAVLDLE